MVILAAAMFALGCCLTTSVFAADDSVLVGSTTVQLLVGSMAGAVWLHAYRFESTATGESNRLRLYAAKGTNAHTVEIGVYNDEPRLLLGSCVIHDISDAGGWYGCQMRQPIGIAQTNSTGSP